MAEHFGETLGEGLHTEHHPVLFARALQQTESTVVEVLSDRPTQQVSDPLPPEDAWAVAVQLRDFPRHVWWEGGRPAPVTPLHAGAVTIYDLRRDPRFLMNAPFHSIHFHLPAALMDEVAESCGAGPIRELEYRSGIGMDDPVVTHLAMALRPAFRRPERASRLFVDAVTTAVATHVATTYGGLRTREAAAGAGGRLRPWQARRAMEMLDASLGGGLRTAELARACGLSASHFVQAFRRTTGLTPHRWLTRRRVERAMALLRDTDRSAAGIALACGFADQSHFTRVFTAVVGCPPVAWRRRYRSRL
jgi:AraC-like DNA-binding protein